MKRETDPLSSLANSRISPCASLACSASLVSGSEWLRAVGVCRGKHPNELRQLRREEQSCRFAWSRCAPFPSAVEPFPLTTIVRADGDTLQNVLDTVISLLDRLGPLGDAKVMERARAMDELVDLVERHDQLKYELRLEEETLRRCVSRSLPVAGKS